MVKRMINATNQDFKSMTADDLDLSIRMSEGRTISCEVFSATPTIISGVTGAEIVAAFGADMIILNGYDVDMPIIFGLPQNAMKHYDIKKYFEVEGQKGTIQDVKDLVGRPVGINLEASDIAENAFMGRKATPDNAKKAFDQGADFIFITGNPGVGSTNKMIADATEAIKKEMKNDLFLVAGKCHGAGVLTEQGANLLTKDDALMLSQSGANAVAMPMPGAISGWTVDLIHGLVDVVHEQDKLAWFVLNHGIEGASKEAIIQFAINALSAGGDVFEIGDAGVGGIPWPENIMEFSFTVKGRCHTFERMSYSINR